jgi:hypothetical protein
MRAYKTVRDVIIEPISFIVPRRVSSPAHVLLFTVISPKLSKMTSTRTLSAAIPH